jgi:hypothetical protein
MANPYESPKTRPELDGRFAAWFKRPLHCWSWHYVAFHGAVVALCWTLTQVPTPLLDIGNTIEVYLDRCVESLIVGSSMLCSLGAAIMWIAVFLRKRGYVFPALTDVLVWTAHFLVLLPEIQ